MKPFANAYDFFNKKLFSGQLPRPIFEAKVSRKAIFYFHAPDVIEIGAHAASAKIAEIVDDLIHCMIHVYNYQEGLPDHTPNQYHNAHFSSRALAMGFVIVHHTGRGWALTYSDPARAGKKKKMMPEPNLNEKLRAVISAQKFSPKDIADFQAEIRKLVTARPAKEYFLKYQCQCPPPHNSIRSGRRPNGNNPLNITCLECGKPFVLASRKNFEK